MSFYIKRDAFSLSKATIETAIKDEQGNEVSYYFIPRDTKFNSSHSLFEIVSTHMSIAFTFNDMKWRPYAVAHKKDLCRLWGV